MEILSSFASMIDIPKQPNKMNVFLPGCLFALSDLSITITNLRSNATLRTHSSKSSRVANTYIKTTKFRFQISYTNDTIKSNYLISRVMIGQITTIIVN